MRFKVNHSVDDYSELYAVFNNSPTLTEQHHKDSADINSIVERFMRGDSVTVNSKQGVYLDVSELPDYRDSLDAVMIVQDKFDLLPSSLRERFDNDAAQYFDFVVNPANLESIYELGLAERPSVKSDEPAQPDDSSDEQA